MAAGIFSQLAAREKLVPLQVFSAGISALEGKPASANAVQACREIGVDTCVYVGDSEVDVRTAKNAGVPCLRVLWGFRDQAKIAREGGCHFCENPRDLPKKIEEIVHGK